MIEGVNSTLAQSSLLRANAEQVNSARSFAANPERVQEAAPVPQAPYVSPYIEVDVNYNKAVLQIRDSDTGDVLRQFPSETQLRVAQSSDRLAEDSEDTQVTETDTDGESGISSAGGGNGSFVPAQATQSGIEGLSAGVSILA